jgi:hypothetical protein
VPLRATVGAGWTPASVESWFKRPGKELVRRIIERPRSVGTGVWEGEGAGGGVAKTLFDSILVRPGRKAGVREKPRILNGRLPADRSVTG